MDVKKISLLKFLEDTNNIIIPVYQRNYEWEEQQCLELYEDIIEKIEVIPINEENSKQHFCGSIISSINQKKNKIIIDGQQRITTLNLILLAICKIIKNEDKDLYNEIYEKYLINNQKSKELTNKLKLKVSYDNKENFEHLFTEPEISFLKKHINKNNIYSNFYFFYKKLTEDIENNKFTIKDFYEALKKLTVISIVLEQESNEDPQIIFETLNSSGKKLEDKDLIRNFLLLNLDEEEQENIYNTYWRKIENNVKIETKNDSYDDKMEDFLRSFLQYYTGSSSIKDTKIYNHFKTIYQKENNLNKENIIQQMCKCSIYFKNIYSLNLYNKKNRR